MQWGVSFGWTSALGINQICNADRSTLAWACVGANEAHTFSSRGALQRVAVLCFARKAYELVNSMQVTAKFNCLYSSSESVAICVTQTIFYCLVMTIVLSLASELRLTVLYFGDGTSKQRNLLSCALARWSRLHGIVEAYCDHFFCGKEQSCLAGKACQFEFLPRSCPPNGNTGLL